MLSPRSVIVMIPLRPGQNDRILTDDIFKLIFVNVICCILIVTLLKFNSNDQQFFRKCLSDEMSDELHNT